MALHGFFFEQSGNGKTMIPVEEGAAKLYTKRLTAPRVLTPAEVNERSRVLSAILSEPGPMTKLSKQRVAALFSDMVFASMAQRNASAAQRNTS